MRISRTRATFVVLALTVVLSGVASAQTPVPRPTEAQLQQRAAADPADVGALLDLAKLYVEQHRVDDALRTLTRAMASLDRQRLPGAYVPPTPSAVALAAGPVYRVGGEIAEPRKIKDVKPVYPAIAQVAKVQGYVIIETIIAPDGHVQDAKVVKSTPLLDEAALDAVRQWVYEPPTLRGAPVSVIMSLTVIFSLK